MTLFQEQIVRFRQWMFDKGYREKPLYLTEYGVLMPADYGFPPSTVNTFMNQTFQFLLNTTDAKLGYPADGNRLVQRLSWYSTSDNVSFNGYLFEQPGLNQPYALTEMGQNYRTFTASVAESGGSAPDAAHFQPSVSIGGEWQQGNVTALCAGGQQRQRADAEALCRQLLQRRPRCGRRLDRRVPGDGGGRLRPACHRQLRVDGGCVRFLPDLRPCSGGGQRDR